MASHIPVYGLNGIDTQPGVKYGKYQPHSPSRAFDRYVQKIKNPAMRSAAIARHSDEMATLNGIYNVAYTNVQEGIATKQDFANLKKVKVLISLNDNDFNAYRFAKIIMPYVTDIDENGDYYFDNLELAQAAAEAEEQFFNYAESPAATEYGIKQKLTSLDGWFKNFVKKAIVNPAKAVGKAVVKSITIPVKAGVQATKATVNLTKAGIQAIGGKTKEAKETLKKAEKNLTNSVVDPLKESWEVTKDLTKYTVVDPTVFAAKTSYDVFRSSGKVAGKVFKVLFIKINPITVSIRATLRGLIAINFLGLASRLNVGLMTQEQATQQGYSIEAWTKAKQAVEKLVKIFTKMGGKADKILKSVVNGAAKKPLFKKHIKGKKINIPDNDEGEASLGWLAEAAAVTAKVIGIITALWQMVAQVVKSINEHKANKTAAEKQQEQQQKLQQMYDTYAHDATGNFYTDDDGNLMTWDQYDQFLADQKATEEKRKKILIISGIAAAAIAGLMLIK